jgi:hypothetical protein
MHPCSFTAQDERNRIKRNRINPAVRPKGHSAKKKERAGLQSACDELIDKGAIITGE